MGTEKFWNYHSPLYDDELTLAYSGLFSDEMTHKIIEVSEAYMDSHWEMKTMRKKTSFLVAECFQNVVRHGSKDTGPVFSAAGSESFIIRFRKDACFIASGNALPEEQVEELKEKLNEVNRYNKDELKELYRQILENGKLSDKGGAGLGLIEMARKSQHKLHFKFRSMQDGMSVFYLMLVLEPEGKEPSSEDYSQELTETEEFIQGLRESDHFMFYKGDFETDTIFPMIQMLENTLETRSDRHSPELKLYHAAIEVMQNIGNHAALVAGKHTGSMTVGRTASGYSIDASNPIEAASEIALRQTLESIKRHTPEELHMIYLEKLGRRMEKGQIFRGLGLIDLARISHSWDWGFDEDVAGTLHFNYHVLV